MKRCTIYFCATGGFEGAGKPTCNNPPGACRYSFAPNSAVTAYSAARLAMWTATSAKGSCSLDAYSSVSPVSVSPISPVSSGERCLPTPSHLLDVSYTASTHLRMKVLHLEYVSCAALVASSSRFLESCRPPYVSYILRCSISPSCLISTSVLTDVLILDE